jgi:hypothetical protein
MENEPRNLAPQSHNIHIRRLSRLIHMREARMRGRGINDSETDLDLEIHPRHRSKIQLTITGRFLL